LGGDAEAWDLPHHLLEGPTTLLQRREDLAGVHVAQTVAHVAWIARTHADGFLRSASESYVPRTARITAR
jgi:hypothetical protein